MRPGLTAACPALLVLHPALPRLHYILQHCLLRDLPTTAMPLPTLSLLLTRQHLPRRRHHISMHPLHTRQNLISITVESATTSMPIVAGQDVQVSIGRRELRRF